jgi:hypothetical protein
MLEPDYQEAIAFIDLATDQDTVLAVRGLFSQCFQGTDKIALWERLTPQQRHKLAKPESLPNK